MRTPYVILALPRSRTAWLSAWLTYGERCCYHDALAYAQTREAISRLLAGGNGMAETAGFTIPRVLRDVAPDARYLVVRRDPEDVAVSLDRLSAWNSRGAVAQGVEMLDRAVDYLKPRARVMQIGYDDLNDIECLRSVWQYLRFDEHDEERTQLLMSMRITKVDPFAGTPPHALLAEERRLMEDEQ